MEFNTTKEVKTGATITMSIQNEMKICTCQPTCFSFEPTKWFVAIPSSLTPTTSKRFELYSHAPRAHNHILKHNLFAWLPSYGCFQRYIQGMEWFLTLISSNHTGMAWGSCGHGHSTHSTAGQDYILFMSYSPTIEDHSAFTSSYPQIFECALHFLVIAIPSARTSSHSEKSHLGKDSLQSSFAYS